MRVAGEIVEYERPGLKWVEIRPLDDSLIPVTGSVRQSLRGGNPAITRRVSWPSLCDASPAEARAFADAIRAAADWAERAELEVADAD